MASSESPPSKPAVPASWQCLLRMTGAIAILLFLTPTFYVMKYYAVDRPQQQDIAASTSPFLPAQQVPARMDYVVLLENKARSPFTSDRLGAVSQLGLLLNQPGIGWKRPMECLSAKATLAAVATKDPSPEVRSTASNVLAQVAQGGVVIRR